jgi:hypothetical protein
MATRRNLSLSIAALLCLMLLIPLGVVWVVNLDVAIMSFDGDWTGLSYSLPASVSASASELAADLSTVSTLVPVLLFLFPLLMAIRIILKQGGDPDYIHRIQWDPYPPQFPFFLVMLGLTGTLYGLFIGLDVSGVAELGQATASAESIRATIDRLLDGTATALLSSLVGLIGAFLAARPLTWIFRRLAFIPPQEDHQPLSETLSALNRDLMELSHSSREFSEQLGGGTVEDISEAVAGIRDSLQFVNSALSSISDRLGGLAEINSKMLERMESLGSLERLQALDKLGHLETIESEMKIVSAKVEQAAGGIEQLRCDEQSASAALCARADAGIAGLGGLDTSLAKLGGILDGMRSESCGDRDALKSALARYIESDSGK